MIKRSVDVDIVTVAIVLAALAVLECSAGVLVVEVVKAMRVVR